MSKEFVHSIKVYYEDTDSGGVVYYANYLNFLERARSEMIYSFGLSNNKLLEEHKTLIIVKNWQVEYKKPAKLEYKLQIYSSIESYKKASFTMNQKIMKDKDIVLKSKIHLVTVSPQGKPIKIPDILKKIFN